MVETTEQKFISIIISKLLFTRKNIKACMLCILTRKCRTDFLYSRHSKTGHLNTGFIRKPDFLVSDFRMAFCCLWTQTL